MQVWWTLSSDGTSTSRVYAHDVAKQTTTELPGTGTQLQFWLWPLMGLAMCGWVIRGAWCRCGVLCASARFVTGLTRLQMMSGELAVIAMIAWKKLTI